MPRNRQIAILLPDTLQYIGLESILKEYFSPLDIYYFSSSQDFFVKSNDPFDFYFTNTDLFLLNIDFFLPRRAKTIVLIHKPDLSTLPANIISTEMPLESLIEQLELFFSTEGNISIQTDNNKGLSIREVAVLQQVVHGYTNKEIADHLNISLNTVLTHRKNITAKLGIKTVSGLTFYAIMNGFISGEEIGL